MENSEKSKSSHFVKSCQFNAAWTPNQRVNSFIAQLNMAVERERLGNLSRERSLASCRNLVRRATRRLAEYKKLRAKSSGQGNISGMMNIGNQFQIEMPSM